jgi:4,5-dihydroxyphthalate decarboxylase
MTAQSTLKLKTAIGTYPACEPLRSGEVSIPGIELDHESVSPISGAILRMCRDLEFDVCEMSLVTFFAARRYGLPIVGIPVFPLHGFEHGYILLHETIASPKDLEGKTVGSRAYTQTPGVWMRGILQDECGVDLNKVNWLLSGEEHVDQFHADAPANVKYEIGADLPAMLSSGTITGGLRVNAGGRPGVWALFPDPEAAGLVAYERTGVYPIGHCIGVREDVLDKTYGLLESLYDALKRSRDVYLKRSGVVPTAIYNDPMPVGLGATRHILETLMKLSVEQGILHEPLSIDELFPGNLD